MKLLGVDTTKKSAKLFVVDSDNNDIYWLEMPATMKHSENLFLYIEKTCLDNHISIEEFDGFVCVVGPGSFTGIRVGMSTIKGFNKALKKSVVSVNSFEMLLPYVKTGYILLSSTMTSSYYAKVVKGKIIDTGVVDNSSISDLANGELVYILKEEQDYIKMEYNNCKVIDDLKDCYLKAVMSKLDSGDYGEFVPYYLQLSQAERNLKDEQ